MNRSAPLRLLRSLRSDDECEFYRMRASSLPTGGDASARPTPYQGVFTLLHRERFAFERALDVVSRETRPADCSLIGPRNANRQ